MKRSLTSLIATTAILGALVAPTQSLADEQKPITVYIDGQQLNFEVEPVIQDGTTLVPFRTIFEKFGLKVNWDGNTQTVSGSKDGLNIKMKIGDNNVIVNGKTTTLEVAPTIMNGNTLVPLRFVGESANDYVRWDGYDRNIYISTILENKIQDAVIANDVNEVKELIKQGANVNQRNSNNETLLQEAIIYRSLDALQTLIDAKADLNLKDSFGKTSLESANEYFNSLSQGSTDKQIFQKIVSMLKQAQGLDPNQSTPTHGVLTGNGVRYEGDILNGKGNGKGVITTDDGQRYEGEVKDNLPDGYGIWTFPKGDKYEGEFKLGKYNGKGTLTLPDGSKFIGDFIDGKRNGQGTLYSMSGVIIAQGEWKDDELIQSSSTTTLTNNNQLPADIVLNDIRSKFSIITVGNTTLHFTYENMQLSFDNELHIIANISNDDYTSYLQLALNNQSGLQSALQSLTDELNTVTKNNGFNDYFLDAMYQDHYSFYPTSYDPSEISINDDGTVTVTHSIFSIFHGQLKMN